MKELHEQLRIWVCGFLGSGKSTALDYLKENEFVVIDADNIVKDLYKPGAGGWQKIYNFYGNEFFNDDETLDRKKLAEHVFNDLRKLEILEKLIHPLVFNELEKFFKKHENENFIAVEAIKLSAKYFEKLKITHTIWVDCEPKLAYERIKETKSISFEKYLEVLKTQSKPERIDFLVDNNFDTIKFENEISKVAKQIIVTAN